MSLKFERLEGVNFIATMDMFQPDYIFSSMEKNMCAWIIGTILVMAGTTLSEHG